MSNELYLTAMREKGLADAADLQGRAATMEGTAIYAEEGKIPDFAAAKAVKNMLERPVGFLCRSSAGRVVKLLQVYDSTVYTQEPEDLPAQWGFYWSTDPAKALPFVALSTSPYMTGDCCTEGGKTWCSTIDNNVWAPSGYPQGWDEVGAEDTTIEPEPAPEPEDPAETYPEWVQPEGAHDAYNIGDRVTYNGKVYESTMDVNVWVPGVAGWTAVLA